jgi:hypothetical protein
MSHDYVSEMTVSSVPGPLNAVTAWSSAAPSVSGRSLSYNRPMDLESGHLPGADLIAEGIADLDAGIESNAALLVAIGAPRLSSMGLVIAGSVEGPEHRLYERLALEDADSAHARYNALIRRLVSFERALACVG